eukprot:gene44653-31075_t
MSAPCAAPRRSPDGLSDAGRVAALSRLFWVDADRSTRVEAALRFAAIVCTMLLRSRAALWLARTQAQKRVAATGIVQLSQVVRFKRISRSKRLS